LNAFVGSVGTAGGRNQKRRRDEVSTKLSATVKEAVADAEVEVAQKEAAKARRVRKLGRGGIARQSA
jgi:hypothetical protein